MASAGPSGAAIAGALAGVVPLFACTKPKNTLGYDDALDIFGGHHRTELN